MQLNELDESIAAREQGARYPTVKEADIRRKLTADLEALEQEASVRDIVNVSRDILDYVRAIDLEKAKMLSDYFDSYIQERLKWVKYKRAYNRPHRQPVYKIHNLQITWPEVLSPLGHTVGLIHCHHGYLHLPIQGKPQEILGHQPLRRHIDNGIPACPRQIKDLIILGRGQGTVNIGGQDPHLV